MRHSLGVVVFSTKLQHLAVCNFYRQLPCDGPTLWAPSLRIIMRLLEHLHCSSSIFRQATLTMQGFRLPFPLLHLLGPIPDRLVHGTAVPGASRL